MTPKHLIFLYEKQRGVSQRGAMMLEVLISILLLCFGILGIVALQAVMTGNLSDAKYRAEAALLSEQLIGMLWSDIPELDSYKYNDSKNDCKDLGTDDNTALENWLGSDGTAGTVYGLPNGRAKIDINTDHIVDIKICWRGPKESTDTWHYYTTVTQIRN